MKLSEVARLLGGRLLGDPAVEITGVSGIEDAGPKDITYLIRPSLLKQAELSSAACVIVKDEFMDGLKNKKNQLAVADPQLAFIRLLEHFHPRRRPQAGISGQAFVSEGAQIDGSSSVLPFVFIGEGAQVGAGTLLYPGVFVGEGSKIGRDCILHSNVTIREGVTIGDRVIIHSGTVIGSDGFGYIMREGRHVKIPQVGGVVIEDDVEIGSCTAIDRATTGNTLIGRGSKIDNLVQIAHNVKIGAGSIIAGQAGIGGSTTLGNYVIMAAQSGIADHTRIEDGSILGAGSGVLPNTTLPKGAYAGAPVLPHRQWLRAMSLTARLPEMNKAMQDLEKRLSELERRFSHEE